MEDEFDWGLDWESDKEWQEAEYNAIKDKD